MLKSNSVESGFCHWFCLHYGERIQQNQNDTVKLLSYTLQTSKNNIQKL